MPRCARRSEQPRARNSRSRVASGCFLPGYYRGCGLAALTSKQFRRRHRPSTGSLPAVGCIHCTWKRLHTTFLRIHRFSSGRHSGARNTARSRSSRTAYGAGRLTYVRFNPRVDVLPPNLDDPAIVAGSSDFRRLLGNRRERQQIRFVSAFSV
jgi:hypothetical protein